MFNSGPAVNQDIAQLCSAENIKSYSKNVFDVSPECDWGPGLAERHDLTLEKAKTCMKGGEVFFALQDPDCIKGEDNIGFLEAPYSSKVIHGLFGQGHQGNGGWRTCCSGRGSQHRAVSFHQDSGRRGYAMQQGMRSGN